MPVGLRAGPWEGPVEVWAGARYSIDEGGHRLGPSLDRIDLVPMTQEEFEAWLPGTIEGYAKEHIATGRWSKDEAIEKSRQEHETLLPQGVETPNHHLWFIVRSSDRQKVGLLWVNIVTTPTRHAFIFNIEIDEPFRRHGYATQAMTRLEEEARLRGLDSIKLHVFGHNTAARPLYEKLGYVPTNINMSKTLTRRHRAAQDAEAEP